VDATFPLNTSALNTAFRTSASVTSPVVSIADDAELARAARNGNRAAFGRLYDRYARMVHGMLLARVPRSDVDDLVQDVFLSALRQLSTLRDDAAFGGWLAMITRNRAHDYYRRTREWTELPENLAAADRHSAEALAALEAIRALPEAYREPLILRLVEGMSGEEIAARTGLTPASVRVNLHRGMKQLRQVLDSEARS
jgi:RNA polymerase sigma-70 factor, ECF subfamily